MNLKTAGMFEHCREARQPLRLLCITATAEDCSRQAMFPFTWALSHALGSLLFVGIVAICVGCSSTTKTLQTAVVPASGSPVNLSEAELREKLSGFYVEFVNSMEGATASAAADTHDPELRRRLIEARIRSVRMCRQVIFQAQVMAAFVDTWTICLQIEAFLYSAEGRDRFGPAQPAVLTAATRLREEIESLGKLFLKPDQLADVKKRLALFVKSHPFSVQEEVIFPSSEGNGIPQLGWLLNVPLSPFRAVEGVDKSALAIHELTFSANRFVQIASDMPRELSWELQLVLLQSRREVEALVAQLDQKQTNTQATLRQAQATIAEARAAIIDLQTTLVSGEHTALAITDTMKAVNTLSQTAASSVKQFHDLYPPGPESAPTPIETNSHPFDILDYAQTAEQIAAAATNLTRLLIEAQSTLDSGPLTVRIKDAQATLVQTQAMAHSLADHIALLVVLVLALFFGLLSAYRVLCSRIQKALPARPLENPSRLQSDRPKTDI